MGVGLAVELLAEAAKIGPIHQDGGNHRLGGDIEGSTRAVGGHQGNRQVGVEDRFQDGAAS